MSKNPFDLDFKFESDDACSAWFLSLKENDPDFEHFVNTFLREELKPAFIYEIMNLTAGFSLSYWRTLIILKYFIAERILRTFNVKKEKAGYILQYIRTSKDNFNLFDKNQYNYLMQKVSKENLCSIIKDYYDTQ